MFSQEHPAPAKAKSATLMTGCGNWHYPVSAKIAQAQASFDQGLRFDVWNHSVFSSPAFTDVQNRVWANYLDGK